MTGDFGNIEGLRDRLEGWIDSQPRNELQADLIAMALYMDGTAAPHARPEALVGRMMAVAAVGDRTEAIRNPSGDRTEAIKPTLEFDL